MNEPRTAPVRGIGYARVSSEDQVRGVSLDAQRATLLKYADLHADELALVDVIVDAGISGKTLERPGLRRALGMIETGEVGALVVVKLDRLTRSVRDLGELLERHFGPNAA